MPFGLGLVPAQDAQVEKLNGSIVGPYKASFAGDTIFISDVKADIEEGDVIIRKLPNGRDERNVVTKVTFYHHAAGIVQHYQIEFKKEGAIKMQKQSPNITIHSAQSVQIGDNNTQNIINSFQSLAEKIDSSDATPHEKEEAKSLLGKIVSNPLVTTILGEAAKTAFAHYLPIPK